jgi:hypothetical protein
MKNAEAPAAGRQAGCFRVASAAIGDDFLRHRVSHYVLRFMVSLIKIDDI